MKNAKRLLRNARNSQFIRYIFVGGTSYILEIGLLAYLEYGLHIPTVVSVSISFWFGFLVAFVLQKIVTFEDRQRSVKKIAWQSISYALLVAFNFIFTLVFVQLCSPVAGVLIARTIALVITTIWNYVVYSKVIFK